MALKTLEQTKAEFIAPGTKKVLPSPRFRITSGDDKAGNMLKIFIFGGWGSGKTFFVVGLLLQGLKVYIVNTDIGGSGANSIKLELTRLGREDLKANFKEVILSREADFQIFLNSPETVDPTIYDFDPDVLFWDGLAAWQQVELSEKIGSMPVTGSGDNREVPAHLESGLAFEQPQWGMLRNATVRGVHKFCSLNNKRTGKVWHKVATAQEAIKMKPAKAGGGYVETKMPLLQGAGGVLIGAAFDLIMKTDKTATGEFVYIFEDGENLMSKNRGFKLPATMAADSGKLWADLTAQLGVERGAVDETLKETE